MADRDRRARPPNAAGEGTERPIFNGEGVPEPAMVATVDLPLGTALDLPRRGSTPLQDRLAAGNAAARASSLGLLSAWFPGYDFQAAAQNVDDRRFSVVPLSGELAAYLGGEEMLDRLLFGHEHTWGLGGVSFSHGDLEGHRPPPPYAIGPSASGDRGRLIPGGLARAVAERWTAIVNGADRLDARLSEVCLHLTRVYGGPVNTNIYISQGPSKGFGAHWDSHDTIIVPVCGSKRWQVFEPTVLSAQRPWVGAEVSERPLWEGVIDPSTALVIPRGWGHRVEGSEELSVHCTIGVNRLETYNLLERVSYEAGFWPAMRADVPFDPLEPVGSYEGSVYDEPLGFARTIAEVASPELIDRAIAAHRARLVRPPFGELRRAFRAVAYGDWSGLALRLNAPAGISVHGEDDGAAVLAFCNRAVRVAAEATDAFAALADTAPRRVGELPAVGGGDEGDGADRRPELARLLVVLGLATVERAAG